MLAFHLRFLPDSTSQSVGGFFSGLTMCRSGVRPHMGQSSARARDAPIAMAAAVNSTNVRFICIDSAPFSVRRHEDVVVMDVALVRRDQRVPEEARVARSV